MIARLIHWSIRNRFMVLIVAILLAGLGVWAVKTTPLDALPDLSDVQVIIKTSAPGRAPRVVEDQITYPLTTTMMSVPGAKAVRGFSFFGDSYVYVLFDDGTDLYWARSRVLEYLNQAAARLPADVKPGIGPDATGVGWIYQYALVDRSGGHDLAQLRSIQDFFLKYELRSVPGVAEVATVGGMVREYQIVLQPERLRAYRISLSAVAEAIRKSNNEVGGSVLEMGEAEYMVRASGYLKSLDDIRNIVLQTTANATPIRLGDVATVQVGPEMRRGIEEMNGNGETVGGVVILRAGKNADGTIRRVKERLEELKKSLPPGVELVPVYDRSRLIENAVDNLSHKLIEEFVTVALVCVLFLFHLRSSLVSILSLPLGVLIAFIVMRYQGINANIMSLGGIAIAIGAMVDGAVVMTENAHKHLEAWKHRHGPHEPDTATRLRLMSQAAAEVGPALFFSLLIITVSFVPIFTLESQEGRLFSPLAFTKTYAMAASAGLSVTLVPVLMALFIRGKIRSEHDNPINRILVRLYRPAIDWVLKHPIGTLALAAAMLLATAWPLHRLGSEFLPPLDEGDLLYMPTAQPGLSAGKARELLQITDRLIASVPEVERVTGKAGRAETATDPAPLEMFETSIALKPKSEWRPGMTTDSLIAELDGKVRVAGLSNVWVQPIRNRTDMLATGIKTPVGIKVSGPDLGVIGRLAQEIERSVKGVAGTSSASAERLGNGRYVTVDIDRAAAARYGLNIAEIQETIASGIGGEQIGSTVEGLERYPISLRFPRELRDSLEALRALPVIAPGGGSIPLSMLADIRVADGPAMIRSDNSRPSAYVYVDIHGRDLGSYVAEAKARVAGTVKLPPGYSITWSGQFEYLQRAVERMTLVVPATLAIIFLLLYLTFRRAAQAGLIMASLPFALVGGLWLIYLLGYNMSVAVAVGFIALAGIAAEFGVIMLLYLDQALARFRAEGRLTDRTALKQAIVEGAVLRVRPKTMTVLMLVAGLLPVMAGSGAGNDLMQRIAAPLVGGMITAPLLSMFVMPTIYLLWHGRSLKH
ncbi:efflux RND transporter permease subunit [Paludibacterium yongneupense]|uniref:efflux RND transporter permease subunit n=1 Tax=Paludibacterium yongneupense TaxID=400061 RepID=UPI00041E18BC|nr:efflux RND transporter permease subunit [Paludibacterium yongneupense]